MIRRLIIFTLILSPFFLKAQATNRPLEELIDTTTSGWINVRSWIDSAKNKIEILPADTGQSKKALFQLQVTSRSPMGAIVLRTGGILVDSGWIRIIGSGSQRLSRSLFSWNQSLFDGGELPGYMVIADDAIGGFFLQNGGGLGDDLGRIYYFSPDNLEYEPMNMSYTDFLLFCFSGDLNKFYDGYRWKNWQKELHGLQGDMTYNFYPPLWTKEGRDLEKGSRLPVPVKEQFNFNIDMRRKIGLDKMDTVGHE